MLQFPSRLPREYENPSLDHHNRYKGTVNTVLRYCNVLHLHQQVCHNNGDTMVRTSRFTLLKIFLACNSSHHLLIRSQATILRRWKNCSGSLALVCVDPACPLLQFFSTVLPAEFSVGLPLTSLRRASSINLQFDISHRSTTRQFHRTLP